MDAEDREFRRNQTDIEIYIKFTLGCLTIAGAGTIALGVYASAHSTDIFALLLLALILVMSVCASYGVFQTNKFRRRLNDPEKETKAEAPILQDKLLEQPKK